MAHYFLTNITRNQVIPKKKVYELCGEFFKDLKIYDYGDKISVDFTKRKEYAKRNKVRIEQSCKLIRSHKAGDKKHDSGARVDYVKRITKI